MKNKFVKVFGTVLFSAVLASAPALAATGTVTADLLNVRTEPSLSGEIVDLLSYGDGVLITYDAGDWYEIYHNGNCYYVCSSYVGGGSGGSSSYSGSYDSDYSGSYDSDDSESYDSGSGESYDAGYTDSYDSDSGEESYNSDTSSGTYLGNFTLTAYCNCAQCCGTAGNPTASGVMPVSGHTVAMGDVPFGTELLINGTVYTVEDRGTPYGHVDIYFDTHAEAEAFGLQYADVYQLN